MRMGRTGIYECDQCATVLGLEYYISADPRKEPKRFCSIDCRKEYWDIVGKEVKEVWRLVCPACKGRIRDHGLK